MAKGRFLSTSIATDKALSGLSIEAEFLFLKSIPHLDRDGLILGDAPVLWAIICPRRVELMSRIDDAVQEWIGADLVYAYDSIEGRVLWFTGFAKNQQGMRYDREPASKLPTPPGHARNGSGICPSPKAQVPEEPRQNDGSLPEVCRNSADNWLAEVEVEVEVEGEVEGEDRGTIVPTFTPSLDAEPFPQPTPAPHTGLHRNMDPRKRQANGLIPAGKGTTPLEIYHESFVPSPTAKQIADMIEMVTDLVRWRAVTAECGSRGWKSPRNVLDAYQHGFKDGSLPPSVNGSGIIHLPEEHNGCHQ